MEVSPTHDTSQGLDNEGDKAGKKKRRKKKESSVAPSPEFKEEVDRSKAATPGAEESKRKRHKPKAGRRKHHDHPASVASEPNQENAEGDVSPMGREETREAQVGGEVNVPHQPPDDHKRSVPGTTDPHAEQELPAQEAHQQQQRPGQQEPQKRTQDEQKKEQQQETNQLKQPEAVVRPDGKVKSEEWGNLPPSEKKYSPQLTPHAGDLSLFPGPAALLAVCLFSVLGIPLSVLIFKMFPKPSYRCLNPACSEVLDYMDVIVDKRVKPCHDFYRHVCGHWLTRTSQTPTASSSSFMADVLRNYTARRHREMMAKTELAEPAGAVSRYYSHCVNYLGVPRSLQDIVNKVFEVSDTKALTWHGMSSDQIFSQLLRLSFVYRLHALFKITTGKIENKVYIGVNRCASFQQRLPKKAKKDHSILEAVLKAVGGKNVTEAVIASCSALDDSIGLNDTHRTGSSTPLSPASSTDCAEFPPEKWVQGTSSQSELKLPNGTDVLARDFNGTCSDLRSVLLHEMPLVKALYPLALLVVNFLKLDFMHTSESKVDTELVQKICHQDTTATFKHIWLPSLTKVLSILPTTAQTVDDYYSVILNTTQQKASIFLKWMSDADRIVALSKVKELHITRFSNGSLSAEEVDNSRYNPSFGMRANDWIYNKLNVLRRTKLADDVDEDSTTPEDERFSESVEVQLLGGIETNTLVVPHMFAVPPLFFDVISRGSYANLATLGFQMARKVMSLLFRTSAGPWWSVEAASSYKAARTCYANYSGPFHGPLNDAEFDEAFQAAVALKVIFEAKSLLAEATPKSEAPFSSEELFFKRACLSLCAGAKPSQDINSLDNDTASAACTIAVSSMPEFHKAFACGGTDQMTQPLRCKI